MLSPTSSLKPRSSQPLTISHQFSISTEPVLGLSTLPPNTLLLNKRHLSHSFKKSASITLPKSPPVPARETPILNHLRHQYLSLVSANNYIQSLVKEKIHDSRELDHSQIKSRRTKPRAPPNRRHPRKHQQLLQKRPKSDDNEGYTPKKLHLGRPKKRYFLTVEDKIQKESRSSYFLEDQEIQKYAQKNLGSSTKNSRNVFMY